MDRELDVSFRRQRMWRRTMMLVAVAALVAAVFVWGPRLIKPTVARARIRTAKVDAGPMEAQITASGIVTPEFEQVISSPVSARVLKILKRPGATLAKGEPILELDLNESRLAIEKLNQQIELKQNQQAKASTARNRELHRQGLLSEERLREIELTEEKTGYELKQLEDSKHNAEAST